jgi:ATP-dependent DNA ligase
VWVRPDLRAEIEITEFTNEGYVRHSSFIKLLDE